MADSGLSRSIHWYAVAAIILRRVWICNSLTDRHKAGMCLIDTIDGALMLALYTSTSLANDTIGFLYFSIILTAFTILVAIVIGSIQLLTLINSVASPQGKFWEGVESAGDHYDIIGTLPSITQNSMTDGGGGCVCGSFVLIGVLSVLFYRPWRRRLDAVRNTRVPALCGDNQGPGEKSSGPVDTQRQETLADVESAPALDTSVSVKC